MDKHKKGKKKTLNTNLKAIYIKLLFVQTSKFSKLLHLFKKKLS